MSLADKEDIEADLEAALMRTRVRQETELTELLARIKDLKNLMISRKTKEIYAQKEVDEMITGREYPNIPVPKLKSHIAGEIIELNNAGINHKLVRQTLQEASINVQIQYPVHETLQTMDLETVAESAPKVQNLLEYLSSNRHTSQSLVEVIERKELLDVEVLQLKLKYLSLLKDIKEKRHTVDRKDLTSHEDDDDVVAMRKKIEARELKLKIMIHMIQSLISSSGIMWAGDNYYLQVMILCDHLVQKGMDGPLHNIIEAINEARLVKMGQKI